MPATWGRFALAVDSTGASEAFLNGVSVRTGPYAVTAADFGSNGPKAKILSADSPCYFGIGAVLLVPRKLTVADQDLLASIDEVAIGGAPTPVPTAPAVKRRTLRNDHWTLSTSATSAAGKAFAVCTSDTACAPATVSSQGVTLAAPNFARVDLSAFGAPGPLAFSIVMDARVDYSFGNEGGLCALFDLVRTRAASDTCADSTGLHSAARPRWSAFRNSTWAAPIAWATCRATWCPTALARSCPATRIA